MCFHNQLLKNWRAAILEGVCLKSALCPRSVLKGRLTFLTNGTIMLFE